MSRGRSQDAHERTLMRERRLQLIDAANARMVTAKQAALDAYQRVHPVGHARCSDRCRDAHRDLLAAFADANADYNSAIWGHGR